MSTEATLKMRHYLPETLDVTDEQPRAPVSPGADAKISTHTSPAGSDEKLLVAVGKGDKQALSILFRRYGRSVFHVAWRILRDEAEADDLRQDVFLYLFERAELYDAAKGSAVSWIMQITYHRAFNRRKFLNHRQANGAEIFNERRVNQTVLQPSTDQIDGKAILARLRDHLSPAQRQTLELYFFEGYTFREIAERSGETLGNVRHHYYRALDTLRANLKSKK